MRLFSQSSQFVFNLPTDLIAEENVEKYTRLLEKNFSQYESPIDYLNHSIKSITFPGISFQMPSQNVRHGKEINYRPAINVNDILTSRQLQIVFGSKDSDTNYMMMLETVLNYYLREDIYSKPLMVKVLDIYRDIIYTVKFTDTIFTGISDNTFSYSDQKVSNKEFTVTVNFNFIEIDFELDNSKLLELNRIIER